MVKGKFREEISDKVSYCLYYFAAILIAAAAYAIWKTKITLFILVVTVIFFILTLIQLCRVCFGFKRFLKDEKGISQEKVDISFPKQKSEKSLYEVLRDIRIDNNERLFDMAERIGISSSDLSQIENGHQENLIKVRDALQRIAIVYNLDAGETETLWNGYLTTYQKTALHKARCVRIHQLTDEKEQ